MVQFRLGIGIEKCVDTLVRNPAANEGKAGALLRRCPSFGQLRCCRNPPAAGPLPISFPRVPDELRVIPARVCKFRAEAPQNPMSIQLTRHMIVNRQDKALAEKFGQSDDIRRRILQVNDVCPSDRARQVFVGPLAKLDRLVL